MQFLVGNPYEPSFVTVTGWGVDLTYTKVNHCRFFFIDRIGLINSMVLLRKFRGCWCFIVPLHLISCKSLACYYQTFQVPNMEVLTYISCMDTAYVSSTSMYLHFLYLKFLVMLSCGIETPIKQATKNKTSIFRPSTWSSLENGHVPNHQVSNMLKRCTSSIKETSCKHRLSKKTTILLLLM